MCEEKSVDLNDRPPINHVLNQIKDRNKMNSMQFKSITVLNQIKTLRDITMILNCYKPYPILGNGTSVCFVVLFDGFRCPHRPFQVVMMEGVKEVLVFDESGGCLIPANACANTTPITPKFAIQILDNSISSIISSQSIWICYKNCQFYMFLYFLSSNGLRKVNFVGLRAGLWLLFLFSFWRSQEWKMICFITRASHSSPARRG